MRRLLIAVVVIATLGAACSSEVTQDRTTQGSSTAGTTTTAPPPASTLVVYALAETADLMGPYLVPVAREGMPDVTAAAAVEALLLGLTFSEAGHGLSTVVPPGLQANAVEVGGDGIVTVDLPAEFEAGGGTAAMMGRLGQLVATVMQVPGVSGMRLAIDGAVVNVFSGEGIVLDDPMTWDSISALVAPVAVAAPAWGATVPVPFEVSGAAPDALMVGWALTDWDGRIVVEGVAPVDAGTFQIDVEPPSDTVDPEAPPYQHTLIVWDATNGTQRHIMECVLTLRA